MRKVMLVIGLLLVASPVVADWNNDNFQAHLAERYEIDDAISLFREVAEYTDDMKLMRTVQEKWEQLDPVGVREYFAARRAAEPTSAREVYLLGRLAEDPIEAIRMGREVLALDPDGPNGYRLIMASYAEHLFDSNDPGAEIEAAFAEDEPIFTRFFELNADDPGVLNHRMNYLLFKGDLDGARAALAEARKAGARWAGDQQSARIEAKAGNLAGVERHIAAFIDAYVSAGQIDTVDRDGYVNRYVARTLRGVGAYELLLSAQEAMEPSEDNLALQRYDMACTLALMGRGEQALDRLREAVDAGYADPANILSDEDLISLHGHPDWTAITETVEAEYEAGAWERREAVLEEGFEREAPSWTLRTAEGEELSLSDLKGQVVILDFWATWCSPCRMAMPVIDGWMKEKMPEGVRVFSVNVWEKTPAGAKAFLMQNDYAMELLYGSDDLAAQYGVKGIPYICAIDPEGKIRFEEKGYSPELGDKLAVWSEALLK